jgi:hypothetical protein
MPKLEWVLLAQSFSIDRETNNLSIFELLEEVSVPAGTPDPSPGTHTAIGPPFALLMLWSRSGNDIPEVADARVVVSGPSCKVLGQNPLKVDLTKPPRVRQIIRTPFFPYVGIGRYRFGVQVKHGERWRTVGATHLIVSRPTA